MEKILFIIKLYQGMAIFILMILIATGLITRIMANGMVDKGDMIVATDHFQAMSKAGNNYVILLVDSVRGQELNELLDEDEGIREKLRDFFLITSFTVKSL